MKRNLKFCNCKLKVTSFSSYFLDLYWSNLSADWIESKGQFGSPSFEFSLLNKKIDTKELVSLKDAISFHFGLQSEKTDSMENWESIEICFDKQEIMAENFQTALEM